LIVRSQILAGKKYMNNEIDGLKEVCETVQIVQKEEQNIAAIEKQIADKMRSIATKIFDGSTKYRMKRVIIEDVPYWAFGVMLKDMIEWNGNFFGVARMMRISMTGKIQTVDQYIVRCSSYDLNHGNEWSSGNDGVCRVSNDHEIANHAGELAEELLEALKTRIDIMKSEKATLQKMAQAIL
jgi:hypothetical protein